MLCIISVRITLHIVPSIRMCRRLLLRRLRRIRFHIPLRIVLLLIHLISIRMILPMCLLKCLLRIIVCSAILRVMRMCGHYGHGSLRNCVWHS